MNSDLLIKLFPSYGRLASLHLSNQRMASLLSGCLCSCDLFILTAVVLRIVFGSHKFNIYFWRFWVEMVKILQYLRGRPINDFLADINRNMRKESQKYMQTYNLLTYSNCCFLQVWRLSLLKFTYPTRQPLFPPPAPLTSLPSQMLLFMAVQFAKKAWRHLQICAAFGGCYNLFKWMEEKTENKIAVHQVLIKNGFYRLPMQSLSEILKLLDMPESLEPKVIQENAINGIIKIIDKLSNKFIDHINLPKFAAISRETKDFVTLLFQDTLASVSKKAPNPQVPPLISQQHPPSSMLSMYNPINLSQYNYMRAANMPSVPEGLSPEAAQHLNNTNKYIEEAIKMQQMYMYYYGSMYSGFNPMMNHQYPGMNNFMNPYPNYPSPSNSGKNGPQSAPNPTMPSIASMGSINPMSMGMNPMTAMPGYNPIAPGMGMGMPNSAANNLKGNLMPNPQLPKQNKLQEEMTNLINPTQKNASSHLPKQLDFTRLGSTGKTRASQQKKAEKTPPELLKLASQNSITQAKKSDKRKAQTNSQKQKTAVQNPPFIVGEVSPSIKKSLKQLSKQASSEPNLLLRYCACRGYQKYDQQFLCSICNRTFHFQCLNEPTRKQQSKQAIQCYHCRMRFIDPLNKVKEVIAENYIPNITQNKFWLQCNLKPYEYLCKQKKNEVRNEIEMRCLKVSSSENNEITWPDECIIKLNGERIIEIPALQMNSSLKKRKDYSIIITSNIYSKITESQSQSLQKVKLSLEIKTLTKEQASHKKIKNTYTFAFAIYFIQRLTVDQLYQRIVTEEKMSEVPDYMSKLMKTGEKDVEIDKISISLRDPYTWDLIKTPVRGNKCHHGQCFDLKTFISFMFTARNRTWKCPVCNKDARKFIIDSEQLALIKKAEQTSGIPSEIIFLRNGQIVVKADNPSEDEQNSAGGNSEKTKKIQKSPKNQKGARMDREGQSREERQAREHQNDEKRASKEMGKEIILDIESDN